MIYLNIPVSIRKKLESEAKQSDCCIDDLIVSILSEHTGLKIHTAFQISTSGALVAGVSDEQITVGDLLKHGNFGLGTFAGLDGEMIIIDGVAYQIHGTGKINKAENKVGAPFAIVTNFSAGKTGIIKDISNFDDLEKKCNPLLDSKNIFYAIRIRGGFRKIKARAVCPSKPGTTLVDAASKQSEFLFKNITGTLVGIWSPSYSSEFSVNGYHFHFLSDDKCDGGHVLDIESDEVNIEIDALTDFHLALPETESFLKSNLNQNIAEALKSAERSH